MGVESRRGLGVHDELSRGELTGGPLPMPTLLEHLAARLAYWHARGAYTRFRRSLRAVEATQQRVLRRVLPLVADSEFGRRHGLVRVRTPTDLKRAVPLATYESYRPIIDRVADGDPRALFSPGQRVLMFATSSGTTAEPKRIPVTPAFVQDYRRGWNTFGLKMLTDHPRAILRPILQCSGRHDATYTRAGIPCGAITGLLAQTQKRIVRRFYVAPPELARVEPPAARYYALMRLAMERDVAFAITANPATLIQLARTVDEQSETLIRDVRDGTLSPHAVPNEPLQQTLTARLRPNASRATELEDCRRRVGRLLPRHYWNVEFLACWTGGSLGHYLQRLADWWGPVPVRDIGLLASEGRVSIPFEDGTPVGVLDVTSAIFEFIPADQTDDPRPDCLGPLEVQPGHDYAVVLTNTTGLVRYRLDDVVRVHGRLEQAPLVEFLHRAGRVASVAGEKLTENQVVAAVRQACHTLGIAEFDFLVFPLWSDPPSYCLVGTLEPHAGLASAVDAALAAQNEEYASRRKSLRLGPLKTHVISGQAIESFDRRLAARRTSMAEQFKRPCLLTTPEEAAELLAAEELDLLPDPAKSR